MDTRRLIVLLIFIFSGYLLLQNWQDFQHKKNNQQISYNLGNEIKENGQYTLTVQDNVGNKTTISFEIKSEIEDGGEIQIIRILLLNQCGAESAVNENAENADKHRHQRDGAVVIRRQQPRQHQRDDEGYALGAAALGKPP